MGGTAGSPVAGVSGASVGGTAGSPVAGASGASVGGTAGSSVAGASGSSADGSFRSSVAGADGSSAGGADGFCTGGLSEGASVPGASSGFPSVSAGVSVTEGVSSVPSPRTSPPSGAEGPDCSGPVVSSASGISSDVSGSDASSVTAVISSSGILPAVTGILEHMIANVSTDTTIFLKIFFLTKGLNFLIYRILLIMWCLSNSHLCTCLGNRAKTCIFSCFQGVKPLFFPEGISSIANGPSKDASKKGYKFKKILKIVHF